MRLKTFSIVITLLAATPGAFAQAGRDTVIKGTTIEVIQSYKPEVKQAPKPEFAAGLPPTDTTRPRFSYEVPQQALFYTYSSLPLRPLALGKDSVKLPFPNYIKLGFGNLSTLLLDAGIGGLRGPNYETAIHVHHLSQKGDIEYQKTASSGIQADGTYRGATHDWHAGVNWQRNQYFYYGYDHKVYDYSSTDSLSQVFNTFRLQLDMQPAEGGYRKVSYHPEIHFSNYSDRHDASETTFGFNAPFHYNIDSLQLVFGLNADITQYNSGFINESNNVLRLTPGIKYNGNGLRLHAFFNPTFGKDITYLLPDLFLGYNVPNSQFVIAAGWQSRLRRNTYEELSTYNPFMFNNFSIGQTRIDEVFGNIQSNVGNHISFGARVSWWSYKNLPLFLNDTFDQKQFYIVYDGQVNAVSLQANIRYQVNRTFSLGFNTTFMNYYKSVQSQVWHEPGVRFNGDFILRPMPELTITGYLSVLDNINARNTFNQEVKTGGVFDLGGGVEYNFILRLSAFLQLNNILNNKYERWLGYRSYGFNVYGGLRLKF